MRLRLSNVAVPLDALLPEGAALLRRCAAQAAGVDEADLGEVWLLRRSIDARRKADVHGVVALAAEVSDGVEPSPARGVAVGPYVPGEPLQVPDLGRIASEPGFRRPIVAGAGPAGLFCALYLALAGLRPLVVERGKPVGQRVADVEAFAAGGPLDPDSNVQFGEGGAGTFSDGKLATGIKDPRIRHVLEAFVEAGAPEAILVDAKPHIGTDLLPGVVAGIRRRIEAAGGAFAFGTRLAQVRCEGGEGASDGLAKVAVELEDVRTGQRRWEEAGALVLAIGHSARDTLSMLAEAGLALQRKPFAVGVRIEHGQAAIDAAQHGPAAGHPALGPADYKLAVHNGDGRGVYTFCMCPGGTVVAAASEPGGVCVNGMSDSARSGRNANSALLVAVGPDDLPGDDVLEGVRLQRRMEQAAYEAAMAAGGAPYAAPAQTVGGFLAGVAGDPSATVAPTYPRGVAWCDLRSCLPPFVGDAMAEALPQLGRKLRGFDDPEAVMSGVEARSSSPVRMVRCDASLQSTSLPGVYPAGEGAGYAGGIMSAAVDGLRVAEAVAAALAQGR